MMEFDEGFSVELNKPGCYNTVCVELDIISLAINTLIQVNASFIQSFSTLIHVKTLFSQSVNTR